MGIGDTVMFLPFIKSISTKFNSPVSLLVKESSRADQFLEHTKYIDKIIHLKRNNQNNDKHDGTRGFFNLSFANSSFSLISSSIPRLIKLRFSFMDYHLL